MIRAFILAIALSAIASACTYREEKTVVPAQPATAVVTPPSSVTYLDPGPSATVVYTH